MANRSGVTSSILACCAVVANGCDIVRDPMTLDVDDGPIAVHAMLADGERRIAVLVTRYESPGELDRTPRLVAVAGADVRVTGEGQTITLDSDRTAEGCIDVDPYGVNEVPAPLAPGCYTGRAEDAIVAGAQYELHISLDDGTIITGETEVPRPVTVRTPEAGARIEVRSIYPGDDPAPLYALAWSHVGPDRAVRLWLEVDYEDCQGPWTTENPDSSAFWGPAFGPSEGIDLTGRDSADVGGWYLACNGPTPDEIDGALRFAVFDLAYARYLDTLAQSTSIALPEASLGVSGAAGVFAAAATTRVPVRLILSCPLDLCPWSD